VQGRRRPVRKLARGGTGAAGTVAGAAEDEERRGVLDVRRRGTPRRALGVGDGGGWRVPEVERAVVVEWWRPGGRVEDAAEGSMPWWCRETAASMAPVLVHQRHNDTLGWIRVVVFMFLNEITVFRSTHSGSRYMDAMDDGSLPAGRVHDNYA
jgi:hypothetical protein